MDDIAFRNFVASRYWKFAKTMPQNPHEYTLRKEKDVEFENAVIYIRENGKPRTFKGRRYICLDCGVHQYWTMGNPLPETILINRALVHSPGAS